MYSIHYINTSIIYKIRNDFDVKRRTMLISEPKKKKDSCKKIINLNEFQVAYGLTNKKQGLSCYINLGLWIKPIDDSLGFDRLSKKLGYQLRQLVYQFTKENLSAIQNKEMPYLVDLQMVDEESNPRCYESRTYCDIEVTLFFNTKQEWKDNDNFHSSIRLLSQEILDLLIDYQYINIFPSRK